MSTDSGRRHILKVYGAGWRSASEVAYELDVLAHLANKGFAAPPAISRRDGGLIDALRAPEGVRYCALFAYAAGTKPSPPFTETLYYHFGGATARMHRALDGFTSTHTRAPLDLAYLLDRPLAALRPWLERRPNDWDFLVRLTDKVRMHITSLAPHLNWGVCHGDLSLDNVHITANNAITFYDFDSGGPGWRACDPYGVFQCHRKDGLWEAFLRGYSEIRSFGEADLAAIPYFVSANQLWNMGTEVTHLARRSGLWRLDTSYFDRAVASLREWDAEHL